MIPADPQADKPVGVTGKVNLSDILMLLASAQGLFLGVLILHKYRGLLANRFLTALLFLQSGLLLEMSLQNVTALGDRPRLVMFIIGVAFLAGPLHYLYAKYLTRPGEKPVRLDILHFVPFLIYEALVLFLYHPTADMTRIGADPMVQAAWTKSFGYFHLVVVIQYGSYLVWTQLILQEYGRRVRTVFSTLEKVKLTWLRNITWLAMCIVVVYALEYALLLMGIGTGNYFAFSSVLLALNVYAMGYLGLLKSEVLDSDTLRDTLRGVGGTLAAASDPSPVAKYDKSGLGQDDLALYQSKLLTVMTEQSPQTESGLTLDQLAAMVGLSAHNLSEVINRGLDQNFFDFVNGYRVQKVQEDLVDPKKAHLTVLALALDAGFASKSTFNAIFKKHTGLTPTAWRKQHSDS